MRRYTTAKPRKKYPKRALAAIWWVALGIGMALVWTVPLFDVYWPEPYIIGAAYGAITWGIFFLGSLFYTIRYGLIGIRKCPNCGKQNYKGRKHCKDCGARVFWYCPKCGTETKKHREFCECGQSLKVITFARQVQFEGVTEQDIESPKPASSNMVVTGSIVKFCPACGAEISEDLTHCSICGSTLGN